jgi:hypothetical protein
MSRRNRQKHDRNPAPAQAPTPEAAESATPATPAPSAEPAPDLKAESLDAVLSTVEALRKTVADLVRQRDEVLAQIGALDLRLMEDCRRKREEHERTLAQETREAEGRHRDAMRKLDGEVEAERNRRLEALAKDLDGTRKRETERLDAELAGRRASADRDLEALREAKLAGAKTREKALDEREKELDDRSESLKDAEGAADAAKVKAENLSRESTIAQKLADSERNAADARIPQEVERATRSLRREVEALQRQLEAEHERAKAESGELERLRRLERSFGEDPQAVLRERDELRRRKEELHDKLAAAPSLEQHNEMKANAVLLEQRVKQLEGLQKENADLRADNEGLTRTAAELEQAVRAREIEEQRRKAIEAQCETLAEQVTKLRSLHERPRERASRVGEIHRPVLPHRPARTTVEPEIQWLGKIEEACSKAEIAFPRRLLHAFHASLKSSQWSPLTVLSGVSGTGKSILPKVYSRFGGLNHLMVPVQPNWDGPQSVFGFFNSVENRFNATPLLRLLSQSARPRLSGDGLEDQMTLILLDEMNLAHVELYFSDLLSKLEDRRGDDTVPALEIDIGADAERERIPLTPNVLWCGTMNEDETTKTLSDKVLDRGNMLVFPRPTELIRRTGVPLGPVAPPLGRTAWDGWVTSRLDFTAEQVAHWKGVLEQISERMEPVGRAIGHRIWQSVEHYMANHPLVRLVRTPDHDSFEAMMKIAFEDQVVLKVMPKLRGIETRGEARTKCLDGIRGVVDEHLSGLAEDFAAALDNSADSFMWRSAAYLSRYPSKEEIDELAREAGA